MASARFLFATLNSSRDKLAPILKKLGAGSSSKSGAGLLGKSGNKSGSSNSAKSGSSGLTKTGVSTSGKSISNKIGSSYVGKSASSPKGTSAPSLHKSSSSSRTPNANTSSSFSFGDRSLTGYKSGSSYGKPKEKSSTSFGIIWLPSRKNKKKNMVYNPHKDDRGNDIRTPSMYNYMSGDSSETKPFVKKEEDSSLLQADKARVPLMERAAVASASVTFTAEATQTDQGITSSDDKKEESNKFIQHNAEESKEAGGDISDKDDKSDKDYLENDKESRSDKQRKARDHGEKGDKVDSVYLRPRPPKQTSTTPSSSDEDSCGIKCLYYTLQCCDCSIM